jgi:AraC-type DNA-binding domain-containing proteins
MPLDLGLGLAGFAISAIMAIAIIAAAFKPGGRPPLLALVFIEAATFFGSAIAGRVAPGSFASSACSYCGTLFGLPALYLFERSMLEKLGRRACLHFIPAAVNLPLGLVFAALGSSGRGALAQAIYYLALVAAQTAQLFFYGRAANSLAKGYGRRDGADWLLRAARAVIAAYAVITALSWAIIFVTVAEEILGREIDTSAWVDPMSLLTAFFLAWTLGLCVLWSRERGSSESEEMRKYGGRALPGASADELVGRARALLEDASDLASEEAQPRALAARLGVPYYLLSRAVNEREGLSVLDLVNGYRVERAKAILASRPEASVLDACFESGFSAKSTFNEVFRKSVGMTPRQYRLSLASSPNALCEERKH